MNRLSLAQRLQIVQKSERSLETNENKAVLPCTKVFSKTNYIKLYIDRRITNYGNIGSLAENKYRQFQAAKI